MHYTVCCEQLEMSVYRTLNEMHASEENWWSGFQYNHRRLDVLYVQCTVECAFWDQLGGKSKQDKGMMVICIAFLETLP